MTYYNHHLETMRLKNTIAEKTQKTTQEQNINNRFQNEIYYFGVMMSL